MAKMNHQIRPVCFFLVWVISSLPCWTRPLNFSWARILCSFPLDWKILIFYCSKQSYEVRDCKPYPLLRAKIIRISPPSLECAFLWCFFFFAIIFWVYNLVFGWAKSYIKTFQDVIGSVGGAIDGQLERDRVRKWDGHMRLCEASFLLLLALSPQKRKDVTLVFQSL